MNIIVNRKKKRNVLVSLYENELSEYDKLFLELINGYEILLLKECPDSIFYTKGDRIIIEYYKETKYIFINHYLIWKVFENKFSINYKETKELLYCLINTHLKLEGIIGSTCGVFLDKLETYLKLKETTPRNPWKKSTYTL